VEPMSTYRSDASYVPESSRWAGEEQQRGGGSLAAARRMARMFPPRAKSSFEMLADDLNAGGSFIPKPGLPGYADEGRRYTALSRTAGGNRTLMDDEGEDELRAARYRRRLEGRNEAEVRIARAYEREEAEKAARHQRTVGGMRRMRQQYEASIKADEARRTRVVRKKVLSHDGERLFREGVQIAGRRGIGMLGRQTCFPFTSHTVSQWPGGDGADEARQVGSLDPEYKQHVAGLRAGRDHTHLREATHSRERPIGPTTVKFSSS
jgi:hypothetical protein